MKPLRISLTTGCWIALVGTAFVLGWLRGARTERAGLSKSAESATRSFASKSGRVSRPGVATQIAGQMNVNSSDPFEAVAMDELVRPLALAELVRYLRSGLASTDQTYHDLVISQVMSQLTAENAPILADAFKGIQYGKNKETLRRFVARWAELDGAPAMNHALMRDREGKATLWGVGEEKMIKEAVKGWAKFDSESCLAYLEDQGLVDDYLREYLSGAVAGAQDPRIFESYVAGLEDQDLLKQAVSALGEGLKDNPQGLLAWADRAISTAQPDEFGEFDEVDELYVGRVSGQLAIWLGKGPALAEWVDRHASSPLLPTIMFREAAYDWAKTDPRAALEWAQQNESSMGDSNKCYDDIMREWRLVDVAGHMAWISQNIDDPLVTRDRVDDAVARWAESDPAAAADWVERNSNRENIGSSAYTNVAERWFLQAPEEAMAWTSSLPESARQYALYSAAKTWPQSRLGEIRDLLSAEGSGPAFDWARMTLARRFVEVDVEIALSLPDTIANPTERNRSRVDVAKRVIKSNPAAVEAWLPGSGLSEEDQLTILSSEP